MSSKKKIITVFGATGNQGGSVISALLAQEDIASQYAIRGVTRDPSKPSAQALKSRGVEPTKADLDDPSSLLSAIQGSYAVFAITDYWATMSKSTEVAQGKNIVDACLSANVKHLVWSTVPNATALTSSVLSNIYHFDSKAEVSTYAESEKSQTGLWVTHFMPGYFMGNLKTRISKDPKTGLLVMAMPWNEKETQIPLFDVVADTGKYVTGALILGSAADGKFIQGVSQWSTPREIIDTISKVTGEDIAYQEITQEAWEGFLPLPPYAQKELGENMTLIKDYSYYGKGTPSKQSESAVYIDVLKGPKLSTLADFVEANGPWV